MTSNSAFNTDWQQQAYQALMAADYYTAASLYEQAIVVEPEVKSHYWHLGLALLLQGKEAEAQATWLMTIMDGTPEQVALWNEELIQVLQTEAQRREAMADNTIAYTIRQYMREIQPQNVNNLLHLTQLAIKLETLTNDELADGGLISRLQTEEIEDLDTNFLFQVLKGVLEVVPLFPESLKLAEVCISHLEPLPLLRLLLETSITVSQSMQQPKQGALLAELCLLISPNNPEVMRHLAVCYQNSGDYLQGIQLAKQCYALTTDLVPKIYANNLVLRGLMHAGGEYWQEASVVLQEQESLFSTLIAEQPTLVNYLSICRLMTAAFFFPYFRDEPKINRQIHNEVAKLFQANWQSINDESVKRYEQQNKSINTVINQEKPLKIGYLSHCFKRHSVGWLARWLLQYHDRERFQIYGYFISHKETNHHLQSWYIEQVDVARKLGINSLEIAEQIYLDEIDILIDLDSLTLDISCEVLALKPAPIQVTWLGWDASGLPAIDYYIADPYVLPDNAQEYYTEKIWRLPKTYIAVDGFEVGVPELRREDLDIPNDAVIYLSAQGSYKRHPDTARLQMRIINEVPNSYFLIKGFGDEEAMKQFFVQIAAEQGVSEERLRFLPNVALESVHRANLDIADVILDTYPYNGATTTLETLWMGIPLVTKVGKQFSARNSYTMMMNAGVTEGLAWSDEEYVEWGVQLGKDPSLRQKVVWKLRQSRQAAPLWNARQFTREMEKAYTQMWQRYLQAKS